MPKKVRKEDRIVMYHVCIKQSQKDWIESHPKFKKDKFMRDMLDKYISMTKEVSKLK